MKIVYFAWVRERIGKTEEVIDVPASVKTVGDLIGWLSGRGEEYAYAFDNPKVIRAAIDRTHVQAGRDAGGRARDRILSADDGRMSVATIRLQREDFDVAAEQRLLAQGRGDVGAVVTFTGICRGGEGADAISRDDARTLSRHGRAGNRAPRRRSRATLAADGCHGHSSLRPDGAGRQYRAGRHRGCASWRRICGGGISDGFSQDQGAILETGRARGRKNLGRRRKIRTISRPNAGGSRSAAATPPNNTTEQAAPIKAAHQHVAGRIMMRWIAASALARC